MHQSNNQTAHSLALSPVSQAVSQSVTQSLTQSLIQIGLRLMISDSDASFHIEGAIFALRALGGATAIDMCHTQSRSKPGNAGRKCGENQGKNGLLGKGEIQG